MSGGQADVKLVSNAMANATRRKIMAMITREQPNTRRNLEVRGSNHVGLPPADAPASRLSRDERRDCNSD